MPAQYLPRRVREVYPRDIIRHKHRVHCLSEWAHREVLPHDALLRAAWMWSSHDTSRLLPRRAPWEHHSISGMRADSVVAQYGFRTIHDCKLWMCLALTVLIVG